MDEPWDTFEGRALFLSAGYPGHKRFSDPEKQEENRRFVADSLPERIREAVVQLAQAAFAKGVTIVFGGHPSISPIIAGAATRLGPLKSGDAPRIVLYQSQGFAREFTAAARQLAQRDDTVLVVTPKVGEREENLLLMRQRMLGAVVRPSQPFVGAVFAGGMDGIYAEARLFNETWPERPMFALGATGAASRVLAEHGLDAFGMPASRFAGDSKLHEPDLFRKPRWRSIAAAIAATP
ncbi:MAG: hypothetical protein AAGA48_37905 [Myxococcota bacterium]